VKARRKRPEQDIQKTVFAHLEIRGAKVSGTLIFRLVVIDRL
jgi:hypothetical protein